METESAKASSLKSKAYLTRKAVAEPGLDSDAFICQILLTYRMIFITLCLPNVTSEEMLWICLIKKKAFWDHCWPSEWSLDTTSRPSCVISADPSSIAPAFQLAVWCSRWLLSS